jgi:hypothetical protein
MSEAKPFNGRVGRKSLAEQIDRLDGILDGLAEALQGAVAEAVRDVVGRVVPEAVREAVVARVQTVVADPTLQTAVVSRVEAGAKPVVPPQPQRGIGARLGAAAKRAAAGVSRLARRCLSSAVRQLRLVFRVRKPLSLAVAVGVAVGVGCYLAGPAVAAAISGFAGFVASLTASALSTVRRALMRHPAPTG